MEVEVHITSHAHNRAQERHAQPIDIARFRPTHNTRDGLRLWTDRADHGIMICERGVRDLSWISLTIVTALAPHTSLKASLGWRHAPIPALATAAYERTRPKAPEPALGATHAQLVQYLMGVPRAKLSSAVDALGVGIDALGAAAGDLRAAGVIRKSASGFWSLST